MLATRLVERAIAAERGLPRIELVVSGDTILKENRDHQCACACEFCFHLHLEAFDFG